uniref:Nuclear transport factor 2 family protein n=1 Tax=Pantoea phage Survivor TaxID=3232176 RepID=A0AAU8KZI0_9CAUD
MTPFDKLPEDIETVEDFVDSLHPRHIFIAYEGHSKEETATAAHPHLLNEMNAILERFKKAAPNSKVAIEPCYAVIVRSEYFITRWKYAFVNRGVSWRKCTKADLSMVFTVDGEWVIIQANGYKPYTKIELL